MIIIFFAVGFWRTLAADEERQIERLVDADLARIRSTTSLRIDTRVEALERTAERWAFEGRPSKSSWEFSSTLNLRDYKGFLSIEWLAPDGLTHWGVTSGETSALLGPELGDAGPLQRTADLARLTDVATASPVVDLPSRGPGIAVFVPIYVDGTFDGWIIGTFPITDLFNAVLDNAARAGYTVVAEADGVEVFRVESPNSSPDSLARHAAAIQIAGTSWILRISPDASVVDQVDSQFPEVVLASGITTALLLAAMAYLAYRAKEREREARAAEVAFEASERRLQALASQGFDVIAILSPDRQVKYVSASLRRVLGYTEAGVANMSTDLYVHPDDLPHINERFDALLATAGQVSEPLEFRVRDAFGLWRDIELVLTNCLDDPAIDGVIANMRDVTDRKRSERSLREAERRYRTLVEQLPVVAYISSGTNTDVATYVSPQIEGMTGYTPQEWLGDGEGWVDKIHPEDQDRVLADSLEKNRTGMTSAIEYRIIARDGRMIWVRDEAVLVTDEYGRPLFWQGFFIDITHRKLAEQEAAAFTTALERSNRELQEFAYVASHDLRAPLVSLRGMASILNEDYRQVLDGDGALYLDRIIANADRMHALLEELLEISRVGRSETEAGEVDLGEVVDVVLQQQSQAILGRGGSVTIEVALPVIIANRTRMVQIFSNLVDNALRYTPENRPPRIVISAAARPAGWEFAVRDNGVGIPKEYREKVYGMFQRLPDGKQLNPNGTGMGLAIIARIVEWYGGKIWAEPNGDEGTTFRFTIVQQNDRDLTGSSATSSAGTARLILNR